MPVRSVLIYKHKGLQVSYGNKKFMYYDFLWDHGSVILF